MSITVHHTLIAEELEKKLVVTMLAMDYVREALIRKIPHQAFYFPHHQLIIKLLQECVRENKPTDPTFIKSVLGTRIDENVLNSYLFADTAKQGLSFRGCEWAIDELKKLYYSRVSFLVSDKISKLSMLGEHGKIVTLSNTLGSFRANLFNVSQTDKFAEAVVLANSSDEYITAPYENMATLMGGFTRKDVSAIGGKSGHNKTTFALSVATDLIKIGAIKKLLYISADEPGEQIARRIIAKDLRIKTSDMRQKRIILDADEVNRAVTSVYKNRLIILDDCVKPADIAVAIQDNKPDMTIIDHLQELDYEDMGGLSDQAVTRGMTRMKFANRSIGGNLMVLSQVRDKLIDERIDDKMPRPHDFLYGSDLRRKSRELMVVYWRYKDTYVKTDKEVFELAIHKSTYSDTGTLKFHYNPEYAEFLPLSGHSEHKKQDSGDIWRS